MGLRQEVKGGEEAAQVVRAPFVRVVVIGPTTSRQREAFYRLAPFFVVRGELGRCGQDFAQGNYCSRGGERRTGTRGVGLREVGQDAGEGFLALIQLGELAVADRFVYVVNSVPDLVARLPELSWQLSLDVSEFGRTPEVVGVGIRRDGPGLSGGSRGDGRSRAVNGVVGRVLERLLRLLARGVGLVKFPQAAAEVSSSDLLLRHRKLTMRGNPPVLHGVPTP